MFERRQRLVSLGGPPPVPGTDASGALWQTLLQPGETALVCIDRTTGQALTLAGEKPSTPISEYCTAFRGLLSARLVARGVVNKHPRMICALYNKKGTWLETVSSKGVMRRNEGLGLALLLLQFPLLAALGTAAIILTDLLYTTIVHGSPTNWSALRAREWLPVMILGLFLGAVARFGIHIARLVALHWRGRAARQPIGSPKRESFYRRLAREQHNLLVPKEITLEPCLIWWPQQQKHEEWSGVLRQNGFQQCGQYLIPETKGQLEFWVHSGDNLTATIVVQHPAGMWVSVFSRFQDGSSFTAANKKSPGLDPQPERPIAYLGPETTAQQVVDHARSQRPSVPQIRPTAANVVEHFQKSWTEYVEWRRARGTTAEEYKRIDEQRAARKAQT